MFIQLYVKTDGVIMTQNNKKMAFLLPKSLLYSVRNVYGVHVNKPSARGDRMLTYYWLADRRSALCTTHTMPLCIAQYCIKTQLTLLNCRHVVNCTCNSTFYLPLVCLQAVGKHTE
jgi:hypothetical protein